MLSGNADHIKGNVGLLVIDTQNDFLGKDDGTAFTESGIFKKTETAALAVKGGVKAADNIKALVEKKGDRFPSIDLSEDRHQKGHSATPENWRNTKRERPRPFTPMSSAEALEEWRFTEDQATHWKAYNYLVAFEATGRRHMIWPEHCVDGTWGAMTYAPLVKALKVWSARTGRKPTVTGKGGALIEEMFGIFEAEVQNPEDPSTQTNWPMLRRLSALDYLVVVGLALDYCVMRSIEQFVMRLGTDAAKKIVILTDCTAAIDAAAGEAFLARMRELGAIVTTSDKLFA